MHLNIGGNIGSVSVRMRKGTKPAILFVHGFGCDKEEFSGAFKSPLFRERTLIVPDLPGFGGSKPVKSRRTTLALHASACRALLRKLGIGKAHIVGHSMGGAVGLLLAEKMGKAALSFSSLEGNLVGSDCTFSGKVAQYSASAFKKRGRREFGMLIRKNKDKTTKAYWLKAFAKSEPDAAYWTAKSLVKWSRSRVLVRLFRELKIPKAYFYGERSANPEALECLGKRILAVKVKHAGHFMMLDRAGEFYMRLHRFLDGAEEQ